MRHFYKMGDIVQRMHQTITDASGKNIRIWFATDRDYPFCLHLCKRFRNFEFFYVPDESLRKEIRIGNIIAFDYNGLEAGYIWVTFPKNGRCRINQLAVDEQLWRNKVGTHVVSFFEKEVLKRQGWSVYLSCNTNTPGDSFWPTVGYTEIVRKVGCSRGGFNLIWAKLLNCDCFLFAPTVYDVKASDDYRFQGSITASMMKRRASARFVLPQLSLSLDMRDN